MTALGNTVLEHRAVFAPVTRFLRTLRGCVGVSPSLVLAVFWVLVPQGTAHLTFLGHEVATDGVMNRPGFRRGLVY